MSGLSLHVCGSAGTHPGPGRACSGYLVTAPGELGADRPTRLLLDCGNGSLANVQRVCGLADLDAVVLSHLHPDHCVDLFGLYYALRFHPDGPKQIPVYAPGGAQHLLAQLLGEHGREGFEQVCEFHRVAAGDTLVVGGLSVRLGAANHPIETLTTRVEAGGRTLTYSADTHVSQEVVDAARDADLFVCDATWLAAGGPYPVGVHCTGEEAGQMAAAADAARLLVTHVVPTVDPAAVAAEAARHYDGEVLVADDGMEITL